LQASWTIDVEDILENAWVMIIEYKGRKEVFFTGVQRASIIMMSMCSLRSGRQCELRMKLRSVRSVPAVGSAVSHGTSKRANDDTPWSSSSASRPVSLATHLLIWK
jgi:hypothetical protein